VAGESVHFIYDSDALIQILLTDQYTVFQILKEDFGVDSYVMSEVDTEVRSNPKLSGMIKPKLDKVMKSRALRMLNSSTLDEISADGTSPVSLADIRNLGAEYALDGVGIGESVTHAAGVLLGWPTVSNDMSAVKVLEKKGRALPVTILRSFDLFAFCHAEGYIDDKTGEGIRSELRKHREWIPKAMVNSSFVDGLAFFDKRLDTSLSLSASARHWSEKLYLARTTSQSQGGGTDSPSVDEGRAVLGDVWPTDQKPDQS
jgi:hypothetical protein